MWNFIALSASRCRRFAHKRDGTSAVEFALLSPFLILLFAGMIDIGMAISRYMELEQVSSAAANYALYDNSDTAAIEQAGKDSTDLDPASFTISAVPFCECPNGDPIVCTAFCPDTNRRRRLVRVTANLTYTPMIPYPALPDSFALQAISTVQVE